MKVIKRFSVSVISLPLLGYFFFTLPSAFSQISFREDIPSNIYVVTGFMGGTMFMFALAFGIELLRNLKKKQ